MDEIPTHRLRDNDLLKELNKSNGESPYYEGIENLTDYSQYTKFLNMMGETTEFSVWIWPNNWKQMKKRDGWRKAAEGRKQRIQPIWHLPLKLFSCSF